MKYRWLGNSGLQVSEVSIGSWLTIGAYTEKSEAFNCLDTAIEWGVNFIDTADMYNRGEAEKVLGDYLKNKNRHELLIATKVFGPMSDHWMSQGLSLRHIRNACEGSLQRLKTDYIDVYQCHRFDIDTPLEETCYAMHNLIERGYILHWGVSQWSAVQILNANRICEQNNWRKPISNQPVYNLLNRSLEVDVMDVCEKEKLGLVVYSPLAQGLLSGKYQPGIIPEDSRLANEKANQFFPTKRMTEVYWNQQTQLTQLAGDMGITMSQLALAWILNKAPITSVITGASKAEQVIENCKTASITLNPEVMNQIETIMDNAPVDQYTGARIGYGIIKRGY